VEVRPGKAKRVAAPIGKPAGLALATRAALWLVALCQQRLEARIAAQSVEVGVEAQLGGR
jgi:hypothetical protein